MDLTERARGPRRTAILLYCIALLLPATMDGGRVTGWGWQAAYLSLLPPLALLLPVGWSDLEIPGLIVMLVIPASNLGFLFAAVFLNRTPRAATAAAAIAFASMIFCGFATPRGSGDLIRFPGGLPGPGYYLWVLSGLLMLAASARAIPLTQRQTIETPGRFHDQAARINAEIAEALRKAKPAGTQSDSASSAHTSE